MASIEGDGSLRELCSLKLWRQRSMMLMMGGNLALSIYYVIMGLVTSPEGAASLRLTNAEFMACTCSSQSTSPRSSFSLHLCIAVSLCTSVSLSLSVQVATLRQWRPSAAAWWRRVRCVGSAPRHTAAAALRELGRAAWLLWPCY